MSLELVIFETLPVTVISLRHGGVMMSRLVTADLRGQAVDSVRRVVMLNADAGMVGTAFAWRRSEDDWELLLPGEDTDVVRAWVSQVSSGFEAELSESAMSGIFCAGRSPLREVQLDPGRAVQLKDYRFLNLGWAHVTVAPAEPLEKLRSALVERGCQVSSVSGLDALRVLARQPATGLEFGAGSDPLSCGFAAEIDFGDPERVFIGRALLEERAKLPYQLRLNLLAFRSPFEPKKLLEDPYVDLDGSKYYFSSLVHIPELGLTAGLAQLPAESAVGDRLPVSVRTDPPCACYHALVIDPQV